MRKINAEILAVILKQVEGIIADVQASAENNEPERDFDGDYSGYDYMARECAPPDCPEFVWMIARNAISRNQHPLVALSVYWDSIQK